MKVPYWIPDRLQVCLAVLNVAKCNLYNIINTRNILNHQILDSNQYLKKRKKIFFLYSFLDLDTVNCFSVSFFPFLYSDSKHLCEKNKTEFY